MASLSTEANRTLDRLANMPGYAKPAVKRAVLQEILEYTEGWFMAGGLMYDIGSRHLGAGIYSVWLESRA